MVSVNSTSVPCSFTVCLCPVAVLPTRTSLVNAMNSLALCARVYMYISAGMCGAIVHTCGCGDCV